LFIISFIVSIITGTGIIFNDAEANPSLDIFLDYTCKFGIAIGY